MPQLSLNYDSGAGNGIFGFGWNLSLPAITRKTDKGLPTYSDEDTFILSGAEDLVPCIANQTVSDRIDFTIQRYRPRVEGLFARIERWTNMQTGHVHWRSITKENVTTLYGCTPESCIVDPADYRRIFSWQICESFDDKGNAIHYEYKAEDSIGVSLLAPHERNRTPQSRSPNRYIHRIHYGNRTPHQLGEDLGKRNDWLFEVVFDYGEQDTKTEWECRPDAFSSYRAGFEVRTYRRCHRILMVHRFPDELGVDECPVRATKFRYRESPVASFIKQVESSGFVRQEDGTFLERSLPPLDLTYSEVRVDHTVHAIDSDDLQNLPYGLDNTHYQWVDLDGEGVSGILTEQGSAWFYKRNWSPLPDCDDVRFGELEIVQQKPSLANLAGGQQQFMDLAGDGQLDLVQFSPVISGYYERLTDSGWATFRSFTTLPNINWDDPNVKFVDLTGDGHTDILISEDHVLVWYPSLAEEGFGREERVQLPHSEEDGPYLIFTDRTESIYLADMSGDGLTDIVRIRNGEICYWPNLGYGHFGAKITMDNAPWFDTPDLFDQRRIRLADIDGSGNTDIIYLSANGARLYFNQSGNSWSAPEQLTDFPRVDNMAAVQVVDLFGNGTACLLWSSSLPGDSSRQMRYIDLMGGQKPHLLRGVRNNLGAEVRIHYSTSTSFYLEDKLADHPWITRLPFPIHVVERVETLDHISHNRFVTRYAYHHGYFDGVEREFRGFGMVEQWDTEFLEALNKSDTLQSTNIDIASHVPPILTRTWFHTGAFLEGEIISQQIAHEYYGAQQWGAFEATLLPDTILPDGLTDEEVREAYRALKGSILRQETYGLDESPKQHLPYSISERNYTVKLLQPRGNNRHAVFYVHPREAIDYHLERTTDDPRITHQIVLKVDNYGNVERTVNVAYPRNQSPKRLPEQAAMHMTLSLNRFANLDDEGEWYRAGLPVEQRQYEVVNPPPMSQFSFSEIAELVERLIPVGQYDPIAENMIPYEQWNSPNGSETIGLRLTEHTRIYYRSNDLEQQLPLGEAESMALPFAGYKLAFTPGLLTTVYGDRIYEPTLEEAGYVHTENDMNWWMPSGRVFYTREQDTSYEQELNEAQMHFFLPRRFVDPIGNPIFITYDAYDFLLIETQDALGNLVRADQDYRVLQPYRLTDPNGNRSEVAFDALGMVAGTAMMGKLDEALGDSLEGFRADLDQGEIDAFFDNPRGEIANTLLGNATTRIIYDLNRYYRESDPECRQPAFTATIARETHFHELADGQRSKVQVSLSYSDGFEREIQKKIQAEPGPVVAGDQYVNPRWVGSGWTIFNNKGKPVRQYEPFFTPTHDYEFAVMVGVSPILFYDPAERVVATLHPNHTWEKVVFDPWQQVTWDVNDTILLNPQTDADVSGYFSRLNTKMFLPTWYMERKNGGLGSHECDTALKTELHVGTPTTLFFDPLGRSVRTVVHNRFVRDGQTVDEHNSTQVLFDIEGNERAVIDTLDRLVMRNDFDMLANRIHQASMEAGEHWLLNDVTGKVIYTWDSRGHRLHTVYDALRRPTEIFLHLHNEPERLVQRTVYGEDHPEAGQHNLRGKTIQVFDNAGILTSDEYDFKGNLLHSRRQLAVQYKETLDWSEEVPLEPQFYDSYTTYDALNRPVSLTSPDNSVIRPIYSEANLLERIECSVRGAEEAALFIHDIDYNPKGQRERIEYGNGVVSEYEYDPFTFRLTHLATLRGEEALQNIHYTYNPAGNISHIIDTAQQEIFFRNQRVTADNDYTYDALYRLIAATGREHLGQVGTGGQLQPFPHSHDDSPHVGLLHPGDGTAMGCYAENYVYDAVGNILEMVHRGSDPAHAGWTRHYTYAEPSVLEPDRVNNRLSETRVGDRGAERYTYDVHGNMLTMPHLPLMEWNYLDQLAATSQQVVNAGTPEITYYVYDVSGQRVRKVTERQVADGQPPTRKAERIYLGAFEVYREYGGDSDTISLERETLHIMDDQQRIAMVETRVLGEDRGLAQLVRYQLGNHLGSAMLELDGSAEIISYEEYTPYGSTSYQAVRRDTETPKRYRFTSKERDEESGLYYHGARYCVPWLGRWISTDPAGTRASVNLYLYGANRPTTFVDPDGREPRPIMTDNLPVRSGISSSGGQIGQASYLSSVSSSTSSSSPSSSSGSSSAGFFGAIASGLRAVGEGIMSGLRFIGQGIKSIGTFLGRVAKGMGSISEWMRNWLPGLIAAPLAGVVDIVAGFTRTIGGILSWKRSQFVAGLKDMGLGALSIIGLKEVIGEKWAPGGATGLPTGLNLPPTLAKDLRDARSKVSPDAYKNGMHAWHAATNAAVANRLGPIASPFLWIAGLVHESPIDWESFKAEQHYQGTVNHILDSLMDIVSNTFGILLGLLLPKKLSVQAAAFLGNYIPGPGDPDPAFGGGGAYKGNPTDAWGQYP